MKTIKSCLFLMLATVFIQTCSTRTVQDRHLESFGVEIANTAQVSASTDSLNNGGCCSDNEGGRCVGKTYCSACSNCSQCAYCNSGGSCGVCSGGSNRNSSTRSGTKSSSSPNTSFKRGYGQVSFWTNIPLRGDIRIYIDGDYIGLLDSYFQKGKPQCGQDGTVTVSKPYGKHAFYAKYDGGMEWSGSVTFGSAGCQMMVLKD